MDFDKINTPTNTVTRDVSVLSADTGNIYETVRVIAKRASQVSAEMKHELDKKLEEVATYSADNLEEVHENAEQIAISRMYEKLPKPTLTATQEYLDGDLRYYMPGEEVKISGVPADKQEEVKAQLEAEKNEPKKKESKKKEK